MPFAQTLSLAGQTDKQRDHSHFVMHGRFSGHLLYPELRELHTVAHFLFFLLLSFSFSIPFFFVYFGPSFDPAPSPTVDYYGGPCRVGPTVRTKTYLVYILLFLLTIFGPIYYGPPQ